MYQLSIFNNGVETVVHYPSSNQDDPHVPKLDLKEGLSSVDSLSFSLYPNNQGYDKVYELITKVKVKDLRDNTIRFTGRILSIDEKMDNSGEIYKEIGCEGALGYLNDIKQRGSSVVANNPYDFMEQILNNYNSKVENDKKIYLGYSDVPGQVIHTYTYKTTLAEILEVKENIGGHIRVRETNGVLYMDWLQSFDQNVVEVSLGVNMKDMIISRDITSLGSRIVPIGANNLTIESVNNGYDYIEESTAMSLYGSIEKVVEYKDIEDPTILKNTCIADLPNHTQAVYVLKSNALDLSFITKVRQDQFVLGKPLNIVNRYMGVNALYSIVELSLDLLQPYNPTLTIANKPITMTSSISDLRKTTIQNDGVYNNVQIGKSFGIRVVRSDNKAITTMNATEGISISNQNKKVFYVDLDGKLVAVDITADGGTFNNITVEEGSFNNITATGGTFDSITTTGGLKIEDGEASTSIDASGIHLIGSNGRTADLEIIDNAEDSGLYIPDDLYVNDWLVVNNSAKIAKNVWIGKTLRVGSNGSDILDIIEDSIKNMVKPEALS